MVQSLHTLKILVQRPDWRLFVLPALLVVCLFLAAPASALAHGVFIFAWAEGDRICTESYFSKSSKVRGGEVSMRDASGAVLASGQTDDRGVACFAAPPKAVDLLFSVSAGQGHRAEFLLPAAQVAEALGPGGAASTASASAPVASGSSTRGAGEAVPPLSEAHGSEPKVSAQAAALRDEIRQIVAEELRRELGPVHKALAEAGARTGPGLGDIVGGIGWIVGLAGLGAFYAARRKRD